MEHVPQEFDWVEALANCSLLRVFKQIQDEVEQDVKSRNERLTSRDKDWMVRFGMDVTAGIHTYRVERTGATATTSLVASVKFFMKDNFIIAHSDTNVVLVKASITLNDAGRCVLLDGGMTTGGVMETWQFRRKALQGLFFEI